MFRPSIIVLLMVGSLACKPRKVEQLAYGTKEVLLMNGYYNGDPKIAENSLLELSEHLLRAQSRKIEKMDYDWTLALTHARLALLYQDQGRTTEVERHFRLAVAHLDKSQKQPAAYTEQKREGLTLVVNRLDGANDVKWKK